MRIDFFIDWVHFIMVEITDHLPIHMEAQVRLGLKKETKAKTNVSNVSQTSCAHMFFFPRVFVLKKQNEQKKVHCCFSKIYIDSFSVEIY